MAERLKAHAWKACVGETLPRVRIPLSPPLGFTSKKFQIVSLLPETESPTLPPNCAVAGVSMGIENVRVLGIENVRVGALPCGGSGTTGAGRPLPRDAAPCHANGLPEAVTGRRFFVMRTSRCYGDPNGDKVVSRVSLKPKRPCCRCGRRADTGSGGNMPPSRAIAAPCRAGKQRPGGVRGVPGGVSDCASLEHLRRTQRPQSPCFLTRGVKEAIR